MKKIIKIIGNIVMIAALAFVVKKLLDMDISLSQFRDIKVISALVLCLLITAVIIIFSCYPWLVFTRSLSGRKIPFSTAMPVYTQSNLYKYLPGNVFQYVGRNQLAADMDISHVDVACATVLDVLFCVFWTAVISVVMLGGQIAELMAKYGRNLLIVGAVGILLVILLILAVRLKFRDKFKAYISRYSKAFAKGNRPMLLRGAFYYLLQNSVSAAMYFVCLSLIVPQAKTGELIALTGAFMFAWIIGFVTPGAPGGIGIREGVMLFVCGDKFADRIVLFVLVMRIASIGADVAAFIIGKIFGAKAERTKS
ncbi:MAG: lysylphosphatidylglycerol synthase domain-containing protein [Ruminococcus sp.]|uniref:lysylphosphatidylglycerol synthase domain-containing protein n=1 Tax=Ruminococcus sp. TaxID=41978 RepID=UPI0025DD0755|nr:lysylphosphatidylglycerol synthase domain-containing protein [Ruminococcus sp.]MCR4795885.1 lysylphosphatidylglycerol synthase domain-containing protein [Ruminococcus sp.]